jgi:hypothetical protein
MPFNFPDITAFGYALDVSGLTIGASDLWAGMRARSDRIIQRIWENKMDAFTFSCTELRLRVVLLTL